jgi:hypothetical protein
VHGRRTEAFDQKMGISRRDKENSGGKSLTVFGHVGRPTRHRRQPPGKGGDELGWEMLDYEEGRRKIR